MKLCLIASARSIHSWRWIRYFAERGHEIHWISLPSNAKPQFPLSQVSEFKNIKLYESKRFPIKLINFLKNIVYVKNLVKEISPDILHAHCAGVNGFCGAMTGFHPFILTSWGSDILIYSKSKILRPLIKFALKKADLITCNGEVMRKEIIKLGADPLKIRFIYWSTNVHQFKPGLKNKELMKKLGIFNSFTIISLRSLEPMYDVGTLIHSIPLVLREIPKVKFIIAGEGSQKLKLKKLAESLGISSHVKFIGWISHNELPQYLKLADIYVSTSLSDGDLSQSTQQAMACEIPIITTDIEVNRKRIEDGVNGLLFPAKDSKSLAGKIITLLKDENLRLRLGKAGRKTIEEKLNYHKEMKKVEGLYRELKNKFKSKE